jgi:tetratricopeptide (TPR) repeat protein
VASERGAIRDDELLAAIHCVKPNLALHFCHSLQGINLALTQGRRGGAKWSGRRLVTNLREGQSLDSDEADRIFDAIVAAVARGDRKRALHMADVALRYFLDEPLVLLLAAESLDEQGRLPEALSLLTRASEIAPEQAEVWRRIGALMVRQGRTRDALGALEKALDIEPDSVPTLLAAGEASYRLGALTSAGDYFRRVAERAPKEASAVAALALIAARRQKTDDARALANRALVLQPNLLTAEMALARADLIEGLAEATRERTTRLLHRPDLYDDNRVGVLDLRADAFDMLDLRDEAFGDYQSRNAILRRANGPRIEREISERRVDEARRLTKYFAHASNDPWRASTGEDHVGARAASGHAFLVGFPRSGTTLLERVLAAHPGVATLSEVDHLAEVGRGFLADAKGLDSLAQLTPHSADTARESYWRGVAATLGGKISDKVVIDKLPLHITALPTVAKLFPRAKILFAMRDPRDVVFSCFRRRFQMNSAMFEFLDLKDAATYYDAVMTLDRTYRARLPLTVREVRHETMVSNFAVEVREALVFLGLEWDPAVERFAERLPVDAQTPSDVQLARGINADGVGQWRRYAHHIGPVLPILEKWVTEFGY